MTTLLGGRVGLFSISDTRAPVPLGTRAPAAGRRGLAGTQASISTDGLVGGWDLAGGRGFAVATVDGGSARRLAPPGRGGALALWLAPGGNTIVARRAPGAGLWRAAATDLRLRPLARGGPGVPRPLFARSPSGDGFGTCGGTSGRRVAVAIVRARDRAIRHAASAPGLTAGAGARCAAADGGRAVALVARSRDGRAHVFAQTRAGTTTVALAGLGSAPVGAVAFVPRSTTLVVATGDARCSGRHIYLVDVVTRATRHVTLSRGVCGTLSTSYDGRVIALRSAAGITTVTTADGRETHIPLPTGTGARSYVRASAIHLTADGVRVLFSAIVRGRGVDVWSVGANGRDAVLLTPPRDWTATTRTFVRQSLDGSHAWTNVAGRPRVALYTIPTRDFAEKAFTPR